MELSHTDEKGNARMVDVSGKDPSVREAAAVGRVLMGRDTISRIVNGNVPKGDVLAVARVAGIMAAKRTQELIPMCHNVPLDSVGIKLAEDMEKECINIEAVVRCTWRTGVEMEALTAVTAAALTVYDMCKAVDKGMVITDVMLVRKTGGKNGDFERSI